MSVICLLFPPTAHLESIAEACHRFSPQISLRKAGEAGSACGAVFLDVARTYALFARHPHDLIPRLQALCERFGGPRPRIALGASAGAALAFARLGKRGSIDAMAEDTLPLDSLRDLASPFAPDAGIERRLEFLTDMLFKLGLRTVRDFRALPVRALASRFGAEAVRLHRFFSERQPPAWPAFPLPERVVEQAELGTPDTLQACHDLDSLLFPLRGVLDRAMARLRARGLRASVIELEFRLERNEPDTNRKLRVWRLEFPLPQGSAQGVLPILRERVSFDLGRQPLQSGAVAVRVEILEAAPGHGAQRDFFHRREEESEAWDGLVARLVAKLGPDRAFVARPVDRHLPERAWAPALEPLPPAGAARGVGDGGTAGAAPGLMLKAAEPRAEPELEAARPARLLKTPLPLQRLGEFIITMPPPGGAGSGGATLRKQRWKILEFHGPERISGEWWKSGEASSARGAVFNMGEASSARGAVFNMGEASSARGAVFNETTGFDRDYFRAVTESGEHLWIFRTRGNDVPRLWLHGYFD
jgi:protein ImuB